MLNAGPWCRLPLTIQWLKQEYQQNFPVEKPPPIHMPIAYGPLRIAKEVEEEPADNAVDEVSKLCYFCSNEKAGTDVCINSRNDDFYATAPQSEETNS